MHIRPSLSLWLWAKFNLVIETTLWRLILKSKLIVQIDFLLEKHRPWWQPSQSLWPKWESLPSRALQISPHWVIRHLSSFLETVRETHTGTLLPGIRLNHMLLGTKHRSLKREETRGRKGHETENRSEILIEGMGNTWTQTTKDKWSFDERNER